MKTKIRIKRILTMRFTKEFSHAEDEFRPEPKILLELVVT